MHSNTMQLERYISPLLLRLFPAGADPEQPGPIYFLTSRKCNIFSVKCEVLPRQVNFLTDAAGDCWKGANAVLSQLHYFENHGLGEKEVHLHADNCCGQNKNNCTMQSYLASTYQQVHNHYSYESWQSSCLCKGRR